MFCPQCATENEVEQGYCRHCGQALADVRLALEGRASESLARLKKGAKWMNGGIATLVTFTLIATLVAILGIVLGAVSLTAIAMINVLLGALIGFPLVFAGKANLKRATRLLSGSHPERVHRILDARKHAGDLLTTGLSADAPKSSEPGSVTEHTTLELRKPGRIS